MRWNARDNNGWQSWTQRWRRGTAELDALLPHGTAREGPGVSAVLEGADGRSLSVFAELTADGGYRVIQWQQSAEWAGEAEAPALFGTLREG